MVVLIEINVFSKEKVEVVPSIIGDGIPLRQTASCHQLQRKMIHILLSCQPVIVAIEQGNLGVDLGWIIHRGSVRAMMDLIIFRRTPVKTNELI